MSSSRFLAHVHKGPSCRSCGILPHSTKFIPIASGGEYNPGDSTLSSVSTCERELYDPSGGFRESDTLNVEHRQYMEMKPETHDANMVSRDDHELMSAFIRNPEASYDLNKVVDSFDRFSNMKIPRTTSETTARVISESSMTTSTNSDTGNTNKADEVKQPLFKTTLTDFRYAAEESNVPFFLAAGTALGAHREGKFISHDNDIDIGIFRRDLTSHDAFLELQSCMKRNFLLFDVLGEFDHGLELRYRHRWTKVLLDVNLFYDDKGSVKMYDSVSKTNFVVSGDYVWCATYYGDADRRKYGKYRYRHSPFKPELCDFSGKQYYVPPILYLEEYFGAHWRIPERFDYEDGLKGKYKNIIVE